MFNASTPTVINKATTQESCTRSSQADPAGKQTLVIACPVGAPNATAASRRRHGAGCAAEAADSAMF